MKSLLLLFIPFLLLNQQQTDVIPGDYIEIEFIGQHYFKSLIIYTEKSELDTIKEQLSKRFDSMKQIIPVERLLTKEEKMREVNSSFFDFEITSDETYKKIKDFVKTYDHLFTPTVKYQGYKLSVNSEIHYISYKSKDDFFEEFEKYLTTQNCDKRIIEKINLISQLVD